MNAKHSPLKLTQRIRKPFKTEQTTEEQEASYKQLFDEQLSMILKAQRGEAESLAKLEELSRALRRAKAQKFLPNRYDLHEDAVQAAWTGVLKALKKWSPKWGRLFLAYAHWDISEAIRNFKYEMELTVARPSHLHRKLSKLAKFNSTDPDELAELSGISGKNVNNAIAMKQGDVSFHQEQFENEEDIGSRYVLATQKGEGPRDDVDRTDLFHLLSQALRALDERESHVVYLYYNTDSTFSQIAETLNLTRQRVEQINSSALQKLQKFFVQRDPQLPIAFRRISPESVSKKNGASNGHHPTPRKLIPERILTDLFGAVST